MTFNQSDKVLLVLAGAGLVVSSFLPWATVAGEGISGFSADVGWFTLALGSYLVFDGLVGGLPLATLVSLVIVGWVSIAEWSDIQDAISDFGVGTVSIGVWVAFAAVGVGVVGLLVRVAHRARQMAESGDEPNHQPE